MLFYLVATVAALSIFIFCLYLVCEAGRWAGLYTTLMRAFWTLFVARIARFLLLLILSTLQIATGDIASVAVRVVLSIVPVIIGFAVIESCLIFGAMLATFHLICVVSVIADLIFGSVLLSGMLKAVLI